jgi:molybdopterin-guanine dinucleotide biosynthesis protein A
VRGGFVGAVLTGGRSMRMGTDKALVPVDGVPMAVRVALAMRGAGADDVICVGGDAHALTALGLHFVPDAHPGEGPLGGIITSLGAFRTVSGNVYRNSAHVVVAACDMPWVEAAHVSVLVDALDAAAPEVDVALSAQHLFGAWRSERALPVLERAFADGERAPKRALALLRTITVDLAEGAWSADVDTPDDLA